MAGDSENRLRKVMDKLYHAPRPRLSSLSRPRGGYVSASKGTAARAQASSGSAGLKPPCRPWDRGDLIRRLATFKAMTWFGKPKVVSPVNCASRGWINVEMDVIVCEACGARLLFSTPPSWTLQQVERAAAVFSLKLDNGHKLLCPWINNTCDEMLARFPPIPPPLLLEGFKERSHALLQITALPIISSLAINFMKSPQLEHFLAMPFHLSISLNKEVRLIDDCKRKDVDDVTEDNFGGYYQAQKIISLCGWEPRLLPYIIDSEDRFGPSAKTAHSLESSDPLRDELNHNITSCSSSTLNDVVEARKNVYPLLGEYLYDPSSTVLDCRLCGACVGLWFFKTIPRPMEFFNIVIDSSCPSDIATGTVDLTQGVEVPRANNLDRGDQHSNVQKPFGLHLTIAGGPPPAKQNFRPKISLPLVSRHIRAKLASSSSFRCHQPSSGKHDHTFQQKELNGDHDAGPQPVGSLKRKRSEVEVSNSQPLLEGNPDDVGNDLTSEAGSKYAFEESMWDVTTSTDVIVRDAVTSENDSNRKSADASEVNVLVSSLDASNCVDIPETDNCDPSHSVSSLLANVNSSTSKSCTQSPCLQNADEENTGDQNLIQFKVSDSIILEEDVDHFPGNLEPALFMEFDPVRQHRPFCPWVFDDGKNFPGWKALLSAFAIQEKNSSQSEADSNLLDEVDDPIVSVRKLFMPPSSSKRLKGSYQSLEGFESSIKNL